MAKPQYEDELFSVLTSLGREVPVKGKVEDPTEKVETVDTDVEISKILPSASPSSVSIRNCFRHPDAHPVLLDLVLLRKYGVDFLGWQGETLEHVVPQDFSSSLSHVNLSKIQACKTLHLVDSFWNQWEVFSWLTMALNGIPPDFEIMQVPTTAMAAVAVDIANRVRTDVPWSGEVKAFIRTLMEHDGIHVTLSPLEFVDPTSIEAINIPLITSRWGDVRASNKVPQEESVEGEQLRRMLVVHNYVREFQDKLRDQLEILRHV